MEIPKFVYAIIIFVSVIPAVIISDVVFDSNNVFVIMLIWIAYMLPIVGIYAFIQSKIQAPKVNKELEIKFYQECRKNKVTNLSSEANKQKAILIAQNLNCKYTNIEEYFQKAEQACIEVENQEKAEKQNAEFISIRNEEIEKHNTLIKYATFSGRDKRVAILTDTQAEYLKQAQTLRNGMDAVMRSSQQKEINWATHGGIASGLAGGAAGVAVAVDAQIKNAQIRAQNEANFNALAPGAISVYSSASNYEKEAKNLQISIDSAKIKLVTDTPKETVFCRLKIQKYNVSISKTGAFSVKATVGLNENFTIFDNSPAVVDGTLAASLYQNGYYVGTAFLVLPTFGIGKTAKIEGLCLCNADPNIPYELRITPYLLWEMEA